MSEGLAQYESTVAGFGNATESIKSYVSTYDTDFFRNWTEKHNLAMEKLKSAQDVAGGIGGSVLAGQLALSNIKDRLKPKKTEGDEDGDSKPDEDEEQPVEEQGRIPPEEEETPEAVEGGDLLPEGAGAVAEGSSAGPSGGLSAEAAAQFTEDPPTSTFESSGNLSGYEPPETMDAVPPTQELQTFGASPAETTTAAGTESTLVTGEGTVAAAGEGTVAAAGEAAATLSAVGDAALAAGTFALDAVPVVGILASVGVGLYEIFHHTHKPPSAPITATASSKGEMVLPSFDSVTDTPASSSAF